MLIRAATAMDADVIASLLAELGYPTDPAAMPGRLAAIRASGGTVLLAAPDGEEPVGLVGLHAFPVLHATGSVAYITALVVAARAQGKGAGRALVAAAEAWARAAGCTRLTVTSGEHRSGAHTFYPRVGMPYTGRRYSRALANESPRAR